MLAARAPPSKPRSFLWRDGWIALRNRLIADPRFQRWAAASPLTRLIARRRARALFDLCAGFVYSQILLACVRLRLFEILSEGPRTPESLSGPLGLSADAANRLLRGAVALRLVRALPANRFALDDLGAALLGNPSVAALVEHHSLLYDDLRDPVALLRGEAPTRLSRFWPYAGDAPQRESTDESLAQKENYGAYSRLMSQSHALVAEDILDAYPIARHRRLLDVGGGEGAFVAAAAAWAPQLELMLFDLAPVVAQASARLEAQDLAGGSKFLGAVFFAIACPLAPMSSRWCASFMITTTNPSSNCCALSATPCRSAASCFWLSRWRKPQAPSPWATPISASISWRWDAAPPAHRWR